TSSGTITDPGTLDTFTLRVSWGDGTVDTQTLPAGSTSFSVQHHYLDDTPSGTSSDQFAVGLTLTDDDGGAASAGTTTTEIIANGGFETGNFSGWTISTPTNASWRINNA